MLSLSRIVQIGENVTGFSLSGSPILGVLVDNPSGSWLVIVTSPNSQSHYVPPYTVGWSRQLDATTTAIDVLFVSGPTGTGGTIAGNPPEVTISSEPLGNSDGTRFIDRSEVIKRYANSQFVMSNVSTRWVKDDGSWSTDNLQAYAPPSRQLRLYSFIAALCEASQAGGVMRPLRVTLTEWDMATATIVNVVASGTINIFNPMCVIDFHASGLDWPIGYAIRARVHADQSWQTVGTQEVALTAIFGVV